MSLPVRYLSTTMPLVLLALAYGVWQGRAERPGPRLERPTAAISRPAPAPPAWPTAREILDRRAEPAISAEQTARLEALDTMWLRESRALASALAAAQEEFSRFVSARSPRGATVGEIQQKSEDYRALSAELSERRQLHSAAALDVLEAWQRDRLARPQPVTGGRR